MSLTGKEIAQMHKDYVMQSWSKSGVDALPVEEQREYISMIMMVINMQIWPHCLYALISDMSFQKLLMQ